MPSTRPADGSSADRPPQSIMLTGGLGAPARARGHLRTALDPDAYGQVSDDAVLVASELVTNSVVHAGVGADATLLLELTTFIDSVRLAVTDSGSALEPVLLPIDPTRSGGRGLQLVDRLSSAWGVIRDSAGTTRVWCELPRNGAVGQASVRGV